MEQPLPMTASLAQDQYQQDTKPIITDMPFNMAGKMMSDGFSLSNMQNDMREMISHQQDFNSTGERKNL